MAHWALQCAKCKNRFMHFEIPLADIVDYFLPSKPVLPPTEYECPTCGHRAMYERSDLIYQPSSRAKAN
jgi:DNA-directed RNA polymerase subunit RPC12/RpoP